jgi:SAM-dependent methyltransferase
MRGYHEASYGDAFADVYDDWYANISDVDATVRTLAGLAGTGPVLELGVGTGRLAIPLAAAGVAVHGLDSSEAMLQQMASKPGGSAVHAHLGDMVGGLPTGPFSLAFVAYNTFFNLLTDTDQRACFAAVAQQLADGGLFVIEAFVPEAGRTNASAVTVRSITADRVVLSVSTSDPAAQRAEGQYVDITEAGGVRLRPWSIRWATPDQLDEMAATAGFTLQHRWEDFGRTPFDTESERHVSVFCKETRVNSGSVRPSTLDRS